MKQIHISQIKAQCIFYASENELHIETLTNDTFKASNTDSIVDVPISHLYEQLQNGWSINETLENETCYNGAD